MLLVFNMMLGMLPAQALAAKGSSGKVKVSVSSKSKSKSSSSKSKSKSSSSSSSRSSSSKSSSSKSSSSTKSMSKKLEAKLAAEAKAAAEAEALKQMASAGAASTSMEDPKFDSQLTIGDGVNVTANPPEGTVITDANGNIVTTTSQTTTTDGTIPVKGGVLADIEGKETYTEIITTNPEGLELGSFWELDGSEKVEWTVEDLGNGPQTPVEVEIIPGETTEGVAKTE